MGDARLPSTYYCSLVLPNPDIMLEAYDYSPGLGRLYESTAGVNGTNHQSGEDMFYFSRSKEKKKKKSNVLPSV